MLNHIARIMFDLELAKQTDNSLELSRHLDSVELNVVELNTLVDELLTYAKQERTASPLELESLSAQEINNWLNNQIDRAQSSHDFNHTTNFTTDMAGEESISLSLKLMAHAVSNALQNAMRFAESKIDVNLQIVKNEWVLAVEDDRIGIPPAQRERVFESFARLDESRKRDSGGFDLRLSIVRKIARWHQGDAHILECQTLCGTRLEIRWPVCVKPDTDDIRIS